MPDDLSARIAAMRENAESLAATLGYDWLGNLEPDPEVRHHDRRKQKPHICRHCGAEIIPCQGAHDIPVCKGWKHTQFIASMPIGAHYCEGRSINPSAEPREDKGNA